MVKILSFVGSILFGFILTSLFFVQPENPFLQYDIDVISSHPLIESSLSSFKDILKEDYEGYRGHIYRVFTYTMHFLHGEETHKLTIARALVYHDLGLWVNSNHTLAYLAPSWGLA